MADFGVTQYIGARYVPKFYENSDGTEEWRSGVEYEPLTIVTYNGNSYTSKKPVPSNIGNPSDNPSYWVSTGNYNQQVEEYRQEVQEYKNTVDDLAEDVNANYPGKAIFVGDSYGTELHSRWPDFLAQYMGYASGDWYNACQDGYSFGSQITGYEGALMTVVNGMTEDEREQVKLVILAAGINDCNQDQDLIKTNMGHFCATVNEKLPNAIIYIGFCGNSVEGSSILNGRGYREIAAGVHTFTQCGEFGAHFIPNLQYVLHNYAYMSSDGIHPTQDGGRAIARHIASAVRGCGAQVSYYEKIENAAIDEKFSFTTNMDSRINRVNVLATDTYSIKALTHYITNDVEVLDWAFKIGVVFSAATTINLGEQILMGVFSDDLYSGKPGYSLMVRASFRYADNTVKMGYARLLVNGGKLILRVDNIGGNYTSTGDSITQIVLNPVTITIPTMCC